MILLKHLAQLLSILTVLFTFDITANASAKTEQINPPNSMNEDKPPSIRSHKFGYLRVKVIDGRTMEPLQDAEIVIIENGKRYRTNKLGLTPWIEAPVLRNARLRRFVNELHGQLTLISYKNGYRDTIHSGVRMNEGAATKTTVWQYKIIPSQNERIEPVYYMEPYHRLWLIQLADRFRQKSQIGEGYEHP